MNTTVIRKTALRTTYVVAAVLALTIVAYPKQSMAATINVGVSAGTLTFSPDVTVPSGTTMTITWLPATGYSVSAFQWCVSGMPPVKLSNGIATVTLNNSNSSLPASNWYYSITLQGRIGEVAVLCSDSDRPIIRHH